MKYPYFRGLEADRYSFYRVPKALIQYVMECLKSNTTQVRNIKQYLLATLYNAPTTIDSYYAAQVRHDFGWGGRSN